jgi:hypothetical protein
MEDDGHGKKRRKPKKVSSELGVEVIPDVIAKPSHNLDQSDFLEPPSAEDIPLSLWVELDGCDPVPIHVRGGLTVHDLKLLFGGFPSASHQGHPRSRGIEVNIDSQRQQIELLGLRGVRPQQIKLKVEGKPLSPPATLNSSLSDGAVIHLQVVPSPIASSLLPATATSSSGGAVQSTDPETTRLIYDMRHELDYLRRRIYTSTTKELSSSGHLIVHPDVVATDISAGLGGPETISVVDRLEVLESKLDVKNSAFPVLRASFQYLPLYTTHSIPFSELTGNHGLFFLILRTAQLDAIMKEMKTLSLALRGMTGGAGTGGPPDKGPSTFDSSRPFWLHLQANFF